MSWYTHCVCIVVRYVYKSKAVGSWLYTLSEETGCKSQVSLKELPSFQDLTAQTTLRGLTTFFFFLHNFSGLSGQKHFSTTNYSHTGRKSVYQYILIIYLYAYILIPYLVYLYENNHIDYKKKNLNPSDKTIIVTV